MTSLAPTGVGGGLTCITDGGYLCHQTSLLFLVRTKVGLEEVLAPGHPTIAVESSNAEAKPGGPLNKALGVVNAKGASGLVPVSAPLLFGAINYLDIGVCLGGRVSLNCYGLAAFPFEGVIDKVNVRATLHFTG